uniref:Retrovirus-related Pol polyprotein from transposon TNT 1-94 n=1 Tax=Tanacetum cinerariifolium TaxID=118510 RepID=A0A6L2MJG9_TANCI|nr:hypothetical protein [Tanacetum cinerariifolium]
MKMYDYGYLKEIIVRREYKKLHKFVEGDFLRLNLRDIKDMVLLLVQIKFSNLERDDFFNLNVALQMFTKCVVILKRVEDLQLGFKSLTLDNDADGVNGRLSWIKEEVGIQLNAKQVDWRDDTDDDELEDQELEAHYMYMAQLQEVSLDATDSGPIFDDEPLQKVSNDDHYNVFAIESAHPEEEIDQNDDDDDLATERELLASLIEKLKCEIDESKNRNKFLETSNKVLLEKLNGEIEVFKNKNKSLESSNNFFKEANNKLSETNNLLYADYKKSEAELARRNSKEYASQMELDCAKLMDVWEILAAVTKNDKHQFSRLLNVCNGISERIVLHSDELKQIYKQAFTIRRLRHLEDLRLLLLSFYSYVHSIISIHVELLSFSLHTQRWLVTRFNHMGKIITIFFHGNKTVVVKSSNLTGKAISLVTGSERAEKLKFRRVEVRNGTSIYSFKPSHFFEVQSLNPPSWDRVKKDFDCVISEAETDVMRPQVHHRGSGAVAMYKVKQEKAKEAENAKEVDEEKVK